MEFRGEALKKILQSQEDAVDVFRKDGTFHSRILAKDAAVLPQLEQFVGVGHKKRIRFIKPEGANCAKNKMPTGALRTQEHWEREKQLKKSQGGLVNPR